MINLILPILFPSWRFFSHIGLSPRIEVGFVQHKHQQPRNWQLFRPLPKRLSAVKNLVRLFHNPHWNELLYINSCAEHLLDGSVDFHEQEIAARLINSVAKGELVAEHNTHYFVFRIRGLALVKGELYEEVVFVSQHFGLLDEGVTQ